jgi:hypothetical protein
LAFFVAISLAADATDSAKSRLARRVLVAPPRRGEPKEGAAVVVAAAAFFTVGALGPRRRLVFAALPSSEFSSFRFVLVGGMVLKIFE